MKKIAHILPTYKAPDQCWDAIDNALEANFQMDLQLEELPLHEPPHGIFDKVTSELVKKPAGNSALLKYFAILAIAAIIASLVFYLNKVLSETTEDVKYAQIIFTPMNVIEESGTELQEVIEAHCDQYSWKCEREHISEMRAELKSLKQAELALRSAIHPYDNDPQLNRQLVKIEHKRSEILRTIMQELMRS